MFNAADWVEFCLAALFVCFAFFWQRGLRARIGIFAERTRMVMLVLFAAPIVLRLALLPHHPVPEPNVYDEFSHLLVADTLLHLRLANPPHPLHKFFETFFVLQEPTYSSIYPIGQGLMLAFGRLISGVAWTGVVLVTGALCSLCYWMLRAYVPARWALLGGALAVIQFGPLNLWMNCYWGGSLAAAAGCLVFGSVPRLAEAWQRSVPARRRDAFTLGGGLAIHLLTRPFESLFVVAAAGLYFTVARQLKWRFALQSGKLAAAALAPAVLLMLWHNKQVTGSFTTLPEVLSQYQYGVPTTLTIQAPARPHRALTPQQAFEYKSQFLMHGPDHDSLPRFLSRLQYRVRNYRFFFLPPLYVALGAFLFTLRRKLSLWVAATLAVFALGTNLFPYLLAHYLAAVTSVFLLAAVIGLQKLSALRIRELAVGAEIAGVLVLLCFAQFALWYDLHLFERDTALPSLMRYETWDVINHRIETRRSFVAKKLKNIPGKLLVFVHYSPRHVFQQEWVWNRADIDGERIVYARDLGMSENQELIKYYPARKVLYLEPDFDPPQLSTAHPSDD